MSVYEQKKQAKIERFKKLAEKHQIEADARARRSTEMAACIPMGQPILVGHHSEKSDRAFRARIDQNMRKSIEHDNAAEHFAKRVDAIENSRSIASDDPDAIAKLEAKVLKLTAESEAMKQSNKNARSGGLPAQFSQWAFTNLRGRIKTAKQRIEALGRGASFEPFEVNGIGVALVDGQIQVSFPFKPDETTRSKLKQSPISLKWSSYSKKWVRKFTGQGIYYTKILTEILGAAKGEC